MKLTIHDKAGVKGRGPGAVRRQAVSLSDGELVQTDELSHGGFPTVIRPGLDGVDPIAWAARHRDLVESLLSARGALLFRGFDIGVDAFERFVAAACGEPLPYTERSSPRSRVSGNIYTSTDHRADAEIFLHNEQSYNLTFPLRILFLCAVPAAAGGATPIADVRRVYRCLSPEVRRPFLDKGYMYVRNFGEGLGLSWQDAFQTTDRDRAEEYCRHNRIDFAWKPDGGLRTWQVRPAAACHPRTGEPCWCNHATFFHVSTLPAPLRDALSSQFAPEDLPNNTYYGDGAPIEAEVLDQLREAYRQETVAVPWQRGDVLMLDNMLCAHGREPFTGPRQVVVGMAEPTSWSDLEQADA